MINRWPGLFCLGLVEALGLKPQCASVDPPTQWSLPRAPSNARRFDSLAQPAGESVRAKWHSNDNGPYLAMRGRWRGIARSYLGC